MPGTALGKGLNGPSLPLDVGQTDDIPVHLRRLVALRDQTCQFPGGQLSAEPVPSGGWRVAASLPSTSALGGPVESRNLL
jgi:hypothetical protein